MILIGQSDSPFVRRVGIAPVQAGIAFEHRSWSVFRDSEKIAPLNPPMAKPVTRSARYLSGSVDSAMRDWLSICPSTWSSMAELSTSVSLLSRTSVGARTGMAE